MASLWSFRSDGSILSIGSALSAGSLWSSGSEGARFLCFNQTAEQRELPAWMAGFAVAAVVIVRCWPAR